MSQKLGGSLGSESDWFVNMQIYDTCRFLYVSANKYMYPDIDIDMKIDIEISIDVDDDIAVALEAYISVLDIDIDIDRCAQGRYSL